jgi:peptide/nickel transport system substrate-binding protein
MWMALLRHGRRVGPRALGAALVLCAAHGLALAGDGEPVRGGEIRVALTADIISTNPGVLRDGNTDAVLYHVVESLVGFRDDLTVAPLLAESIETSEDGRLYRFRLRDGVIFQNGAPLTAREVKWSWDRILTPATGFRCREYYDGTGPTGLKIDAIEVEDARTVVFHLNKPSALFLTRMADVQCQTAILHPDSVAADGSWIAPIGTGPYRIAEWRRGELIRLERFDAYQPRSDAPDGLTGAKIAYADRVTFVVTPDRIAAKAAVYTGAVDLVFAVPPSARRELEERVARRGDIRIHRYDTLDWTTLLLQTDDKLLQDPRLRRAIAMAVSQPLVAEVSTFGLAHANPSAVPSASKFHTGKQDSWVPYDAAAARALAAEAGYRGQKLTIQANRKYAYMFDNAVAIQAMLVAAGFNAEIEVYDWATQLQNFYAGKYQLSSFGYSGRSHPALLYGNIIGSKKERATRQWDDKEAEALLEQIEFCKDDAEMQRLLDALHARMQTIVPIIGLYNDHNLDVTRATLHGYKPWAFGRPRLWGVWKGAEKRS